MKAIAFHPGAEAEITEAAQYYELRKPGLGSGILDEVERGLDQISNNHKSASRWVSEKK